LSVHETAIISADTVLHPDSRVGPFAVIGIDSAAASLGPVEVGRGAEVSSHAVITRGVRLGAGCLVLPGAVVENSVPGNSIVGGNPAHIMGYRDSLDAGPARLVDPSRGDRDVAVDGVKLLPVQLARDLRGALAAVECSFIPFPVERIFTVNDVPGGDVRGAHAHRTCHQFLWCVAGSLRCLVDDGKRRSEVLLGADGLGLYMPPMTWGTQYRYVPGTVLNVAASHPYDSSDYIREYDEFIALASGD
jgi:hypothetical protein